MDKFNAALHGVHYGETLFYDCSTVILEASLPFRSMDSCRIYQNGETPLPPLRPHCLSPSYMRSVHCFSLIYRKCGFWLAISSPI
ncbi:hypothetical protein M378DRAFT_755983 [Amanita muscaria Koide BX008]|uniref:Uncharacterized protein n=1 Tax=Amanita muscaria (strain Koide BX008) TaxID=946122 RepID=A0A0C2X0B5_AMAMK|nr:hypothetical protein M378DRAFT_755983 [Amanita muscaria Koide BX008]